MKEKAAFIKLGVRNGYTDMKSIRSLYNKYAEGGHIDDDSTEKYLSYIVANQVGIPDYDGLRSNENYARFMEDLSKVKGAEWDVDPDIALTEMLNDNTYNYRQMYDDASLPSSLFKTGHFFDTYKTVYHPTFSDESMYDPRNPLYIESEYNPDAKLGGHWNEANRVFELSPTQDMDKAQKYLDREDSGIVAVPPDFEIGNYDYDNMKTAYDTAIESGASHNQAIGLLANLYAESKFKGGKQVRGPARGHFQMEPSTRKAFKDWKKKQKKDSDIALETKFIMGLLDNKSSLIGTPYSRYMEVSNKGTKALDKKHGTLLDLNSMPLYKEYTNEDAYKDWNSDSKELATLGFMSLFERPGKPHADRRINAARYFDKVIRKMKAEEEASNKKAKK